MNSFPYSHIPSGFEEAEFIRFEMYICLHGMHYIGICHPSGYSHHVVNYVLRCFAHGNAVLGPGIEEAARAGYRAFLETSSEANVRFYQHLGFEVTADITLADNGLRTWCMRREPHEESQCRR